MALEPGITAPHYPPPLTSVQGDGAPRPPVGPAGGIARHPIIFLLVFLLFAGAGVAIGLKRTPVYTAEARLNVGTTDVDNNALPAYAVATQTLAGNYSRAIGSPDVTGPAARSLRTSPDFVARHVTASPVPSSSVIRVEATASDSRGAADLVNAAARSLVRYVGNLDADQTANDAMLKQYRAAVEDRTRAQQRRASLRRRYEANPSGDLRAALRQATARYETAHLQAQSLASQYENSQQNQRTTNIVQPLSYATVGNSDGHSALALRALTGAVVGLLVAAALVTLLANRRRHRVG